MCSGGVHWIRGGRALDAMPVSDRSAPTYVDLHRVRSTTGSIRQGRERAQDDRRLRLARSPFTGHAARPKRRDHAGAREMIGRPTVLLLE